jgi:uncharacterized membrane protein
VTTARLEAFSDAVVAILITIMVLELRTPHGDDLDALRPLWPVFLTYVLSFVILGIYWNNHHHMLQVTDRVSGGILWANLHLLFWLSLFPFATSWMGENNFAKLPTASYGVVLLLAALAWYVLQRTIVAANGRTSALATALGRDLKGKVSPLLYTAGIGFSFVNRWIGLGFYVFVALMWLIPDRRFERIIGTDGS